VTDTAGCGEGSSARLDGGRRGVGRPGGRRRWLGWRAGHRDGL